MTVDAAKYFEDGLSLPPSVRKDVALRLLESVEVVDDSVDQAWTDEIASRVDDIVSGKVKGIPGDRVFAELTARLAERQAAREA